MLENNRVKKKKTKKQKGLPEVLFLLFPSEVKQSM